MFAIVKDVALQTWPNEVVRLGSHGKPQPVIDVVAPLRELFYNNAIRRGTVMAISGSSGSTSLLFALLSAPLDQNLWASVIGTSSLGLESAKSIGVDLRRLVIVPKPGNQLFEAAATLVDSIDLVVLCIEEYARDYFQPRAIRRITSKVRQRGSVLILLSPLLRSSAPPANGSSSRSQFSSDLSCKGNPLHAIWSEAIDIHLVTRTLEWHGLEAGHGTLHSRLIEVASIGRRAQSLERKIKIWLPSPEGTIALADSPDLTDIPHALP